MQACVWRFSWDETAATVQRALAELATADAPTRTAAFGAATSAARAGASEPAQTGRLPKVASAG
jgi:hypothetical protein